MKSDFLRKAFAKSRARRLSLFIGVPLALVAVVLGVTVPMCLPVAEAVGFSDVPEANPYHVQIETLAQLKIVTGYADGTFVPASPVTCQDYTAMVSAAMGKEVSSIETYGVPPSAVLSMAQMIAIGMSAAGRVLPTPPDYFQSTWGAFDTTYSSVVSQAEYNRMLRGLTPSERDLKAMLPTQPASRGAAAAFVFNLMGTDPDGMCGRFMGDATDLVAYFRAKKGSVEGKFTVPLGALARYYIVYADRFGIRADMAWAQMLHETGYGQYGGDVSPSQNNMAGIGATGGGVPGNSWATAELGVVAQYAHLAWYVFPQHMSDPYCVKVTQPAVGPITVPGDPRHFVQADGSPHKGNVVTVYDLATKWAMSTYYGTALQSISAAINVMCDAGKKGILHR
jgi:Mannosyl-glycoprotein endo-beta-N-acetylglucosaminidase/S-layer homology domain